MKTTLSQRAKARPIWAMAMAIAMLAAVNAGVVGCSKTEDENAGDSSESSTTESTPAPVATGTVELDGAKIYAEKCSVCHGPGGKGDGPGGAALNPKPRDHTDGKYMNAKTDEELLEVIHNGKGNMPAWKSVLTDEQIKAVLKHVRTLAVPPYPGK